LQVIRTQGRPGTVEVEVDGAVPGSLVYSSGAAIKGEAIVSWDGRNRKAAINPTGLRGVNGGVDITEGGVDYGLLVRCVADHPAELEFTIYTDATHYSQASLSVPVDGGLKYGAAQFIPFSSFTAHGGGASLANVGAIAMLIDGRRQANLQVAVDYVLATVPELSTWLMGAGAVAILLCFTWPVHSQGSGVVRIGESRPGIGE